MRILFDKEVNKLKRILDKSREGKRLSDVDIYICDFYLLPIWSKIRRIIGMKFYTYKNNLIWHTKRLFCRHVWEKDVLLSNEIKDEFECVKCSKYKMIKKP